MDYDEMIDLINAYIKQFKIDVAPAISNVEKYGWEVLGDKIDEISDAHKLDFIGQVFDAGYVTDEDDYNFVQNFLNEFNFEDIQQVLFNELAAFPSDAIKAQQEFSARLHDKHSATLRKWNSSIDMFKSKNYPEAGNDIRQSLEFLLRDILKNKKSIENQTKGSDILKSELGRYLKEKEINQENIRFLTNIVNSIIKISNEKFKHGEPIGLTEKDIRFYMNETYLVMQRMLDIEGE
ncbi:hypothetical protein FC39_GL000935 [Lactobacillus hamsteri DSM 5661 = JCM 6256]|uniref:Uncharacterized protein n=1 Tax=Lactobacillus hamsteri DSM 5661 = JCM 6256 TaxID=1423754 RepID=A0A0R1YC08_9LACO|nr:hypothetical protein [Lactobacillus hamsteri]KRM39934.1 hypothetical protein FC39_GL000935 [Lactobacillus hamsteri DSM 5661 = JCM 6256]